MPKQVQIKPNYYTPSNPSVIGLRKVETIFNNVHKQNVRLLSIEDRLNSFAVLKDGWYDGVQGKGLDKKSLAWLSSAFSNYYDVNLPLPSLYPTIDGKVQAEWSLPNHELSILFDIDSRTASYQFLQIDNDKTEEGNFRLNSIEDWQNINSVLTKYLDACRNAFV